MMPFLRCLFIAPLLLSCAGPGVADDAPAGPSGTGGAAPGTGGSSQQGGSGGVPGSAGEGGSIGNGGAAQGGAGGVSMSASSTGGDPASSSSVSVSSSSASSSASSSGTGQQGCTVFLTKVECLGNTTNVYVGTTGSPGGNFTFESPCIPKITDYNCNTTSSVGAGCPIIGQLMTVTHTPAGNVDNFKACGSNIPPCQVQFVPTCP